jgi:hypothetical protein
MKKYNLRPEVLLTNIIALAVPMCLIYMLVNKILDNFSVLKDFSFLALCAVVIIVSIIYFGISISFLSEDIGKMVEIDKEKNSIIITKDGKEKQFQINDIIKCYYVKSSESISFRSIFFYHKYLILILKDYDKIFITNLIANSELIIAELGLKVDIIETYLPYVDKGIGSAIYNKQEYDKKVKQFYLSFADKTIDELKLICKRSNIYSIYAIIAAKQIIKEKTNANKNKPL